MKRLILSTLPLAMTLIASVAQAATPVTMQLQSETPAATKASNQIEEASGTVWDTRPL